MGGSDPVPCPGAPVVWTPPQLLSWQGPVGPGCAEGSRVRSVAREMLPEKGATRCYPSCTDQTLRLAGGAFSKLVKLPNGLSQTYWMTGPPESTALSCWAPRQQVGAGQMCTEQTNLVPVL